MKQGEEFGVNLPDVLMPAKGRIFKLTIRGEEKEVTARLIEVQSHQAIFKVVPDGTRE